MSIFWTGTVDERGRLNIDDRVRFDRYLLDTLAGKRIELSIDERGSKRSNAQNAWLWGSAYPAIADHCGYDHHEHERLHYDLLGERFGLVTIQPLLPGAATRIAPAKTSSQLTTKEMSDYMEWLVRYAAEHFGVVVALPDDDPTLMNQW